MSNDTLEDLVTVLEWLSATKTPPTRVADALERLKNQVHPANIADDHGGSYPMGSSRKLDQGFDF